DAPVRRLRIEHASGQRDRLPEKARAEISDGRSRVHVVEHVARVSAKGKAIALVRSFIPAKTAATVRSTTHASRTTATGTSDFAAMSAGGVLVTLPVLRVGIGSFKFGPDAYRFA